jgi:hypothetical protein
MEIDIGPLGLCAAGKGNNLAEMVSDAMCQHCLLLTTAAEESSDP